MSRLDTIYRAFTDLRKNTQEDRDCAKLRRVFARAGADGDKVEVIRVICHIEEDWIEAIEKGLEHIGKAIEEERQFIRSNGEVVPIEKVKNVSRESVEHLARHSSLLTKKPKEGEDIIPDQLYTVERLSDYAVYENRFLYMLLCYLRDFITFRYDKILDLVTTYTGSLRMRKTAEADGRKTVYEVSLDEQQRNDPFLSENNPEKEKIGRISDMLKSVLLYLSTPLMEFVSKSPKLKPPITETNVLKMNKHFRGAMQLYYYITAYEKDGYTAERTVKTLSPFSDEVADEFAESVVLASFLTYEHGMGLEETLKERYRAEEARRRAQEEQRQLELLEKLRKRIREEGCSPEEYMLLLEQRNRSLEADSAQLRLARAEIERLHAELGKHAQEIAALGEAIEEGKRALAAQAAAHTQEIAALNEEHLQQVKDLNEEHAQQVDSLNEAHAQYVAQLTEEQEKHVAELAAAHAGEVAALNEAHENAVAQLTAAHEQQVQALQEENAARSKAYEEVLARAAAATDAANKSLAAAAAQHEQLDREFALFKAKHNALCQEHGLFTEKDDFTTAESFGDIEHQYEVFKAFFKQQWRKTKKRIRKEVFATLGDVSVPPAAPPAEGQGAEGAEGAASAAQGTGDAASSAQGTADMTPPAGGAENIAPPAGQAEAQQGVPPAQGAEGNAAEQNSDGAAE